MPYVERKNGSVLAIYAAPQPGRAEEWISEGSPDVVAFLSPPSPITRIERRQGLRALLSQGINRADIEGMLSAIEDNTERETALAEYEHTHWMIGSPFIAVGAAHFGMSPEQVRALFEHAATL